MKEAIVNPDLTVEVQDEAPIPTPSNTQVLIKIICAGCNPKDWKHPYFSKLSVNSGDDMAGIVHSVGTDVLEFKPGDRVAAFHTMQGPGGAFAEYGLAESCTTFHIPDGTSFEEAATIPLAGFTAAIGIHWRLNLPVPWNPATKRNPLIVYGAATAVGSFAIKLATRANIHPIIAIAGAGAPYVETLIKRSEGDAIIDYRNGSDYMVEGIKSALQAAGVREVFHAIDTICNHGSYQNISKLLMDGGHITLLHPGYDYSAIRESLEHSVTYVGNVNGDINTDSWLQGQAKKGLATNGRDFGLIWSRLFTSGLQDGWLAGHPYEVLPGGLNAISRGLLRLKDGKASAVKYVYRIPDTT